MITIAEAVQLKRKVQTLGLDELRGDLLQLLDDWIELYTQQAMQSDTYTEMARRLADVEKECNTLRAENERLTALCDNLSNQRQQSARQTFGRDTEKSKDVQGEVVDGTTPTDPLADTPEETDGSNGSKGANNTGSGSGTGSSSSGAGGKGGGIKHTKTARTPRNRKPAIGDGVPSQVEFEFDPESYDRLYGKGNWRIFNWDVETKLVHVRSYDYRQVTKRPILSVGLDHKLIRTPRPADPLPKTPASPSYLAHIFFEKYVMGSPLYRIMKDQENRDIYISETRMAHWVIISAERYMAPVVDRLKELQIQREYCQIDETTTIIIRDGNKKGSKSYVWVHCTTEFDPEPPIVIFSLGPGRGENHLASFYKGLNHRLGILCDGYGGYDAFANDEDFQKYVHLFGCLAHLHRLVVKAEVDLTGLHLSQEQLEKRLEYQLDQKIDAIFNADGKLKDLSPEERLARRQTEVLPLYNDLYVTVLEALAPIGYFDRTTTGNMSFEDPEDCFVYYIEPEKTGETEDRPAVEPMPGTVYRKRTKPDQASSQNRGEVYPVYSADLQKALNYAFNQWPKLIACMQDAMMPVDNSHAERAIRVTYCIGRHYVLRKVMLCTAA